MQKYKEEITALLKDIKTKISSDFGRPADAVPFLTDIKIMLFNTVSEIETKIIEYEAEVSNIKLEFAQQTKELEIIDRDVDIRFHQRIKEMEDKIKLKDTELSALKTQLAEYTTQHQKELQLNEQKKPGRLK
ncbi:MAG: hypothetical protein AB1349_14225 [Elusimicrobiota bacterium]